MEKSRTGNALNQIRHKPVLKRPIHETAWKGRQNTGSGDVGPSETPAIGDAENGLSCV
jgi:hypothetical protein